MSMAPKFINTGKNIFCEDHCDDHCDNHCDDHCCNYCDNHCDNHSDDKMCTRPALDDMNLYI